MIDKGEANKYQGKILEDIVIKETDCLGIKEADAGAILFFISQ